MVVAGSKINGLLGIALFDPATTVILTAVLTVLLTNMNTDENQKPSLTDPGSF